MQNVQKIKKAFCGASGRSLNFCEFRAKEFFNSTPDFASYPLKQPLPVERAPINLGIEATSMFVCHRAVGVSIDRFT
jgi:hypothetical protein